MRRRSLPDLRPEMWAAPLMMGGGVARVRYTPGALLAQSLGQQPIQRVGEGLLVLVAVGCRAAATGQTGAAQLVHQIAYRQSLADAAAVIDFAARVDGGDIASYQPVRQGNVRGDHQIIGLGVLDDKDRKSTRLNSSHVRIS